VHLLLGGEREQDLRGREGRLSNQVKRCLPSCKENAVFFKGGEKRAFYYSEEGGKIHSIRTHQRLGPNKTLKASKARGGKKEKAQLWGRKDHSCVGKKKKI